MDVVSECVLRVGSLLWVPRPSTWALTVVCKATYRLLPDEAELAPVQEDPNEEDNHWNDDPAWSLYAASDLAPRKPRCDVLLVGNAFAPGGQAVPSFPVRLTVAGVDKTIEVFGERFLLPTGGIRWGAPALQVPLRYERAAGGPGTVNPVGMRADARDERGVLPLPPLQRGGCSVQEAFDAAVGFGPIAPSWPERHAKAPGSAGWTMAMWRSTPMPSSVDPSFFNVAPMDQQVEAIRADEPLVLDHLHREHARLATRLPGVVPRARVERNGRTNELALTADTLWIDTVRGIATLTWRGHLPLESAQTQGRILIGMEVRRSPGPRVQADLGALPVRADQDAFRATAVLPSDDEGVDTVHPLLNVTPALPFGPPSNHGSPPNQGPPVTPEPRPVRRQYGSEETRRADASPGGLVLPFLAAQADAIAPTPPPPAVVSAAAEPPVENRWAAGAAAVVAAPRTVGDVVLEARAQRSAPVPTSPPVLVAPAIVSQPVSSGALGSSEVGAAPDKPKVGSLALFKKAPPALPAAVLSAAAASDAAAGQQASTAGGDWPQTAPAPVAALPALAVELLWFDPAFTEAIRKSLEWSELIATIKPKPRDADFVEGSPSAKRQEARDRREIAGVLARAQAETTDGLHVAFARAIDEDGRFEPPLVMAGGELELPFDEIETLRATVAVLSPLASPEDKRLKELLGAAQEVLRSPWGHMAERLSEQLREVLARDHRAIPLRSIEAHVERILLEGRHMQKRTLLGQPWIRALLGLAGGGPPVPVYLPAAPSRELPALQRFPVRLIAEVRAQLDQYEAQPISLRVVAVGRVLSSAARR